MRKQGIYVYYDTINHKYNGDDNLAWLVVDNDVLEQYFYDVVCKGFVSESGYSSYGEWLATYTADETDCLYIYAGDRNAIYSIETPDGSNFVPRKQKEYSSFIDDKEKMIDFFFLSKNEFLNFYSYLTEYEYELTRRDALDKSGYYNKFWADDNPDYDGDVLRDICLGLMIQEWLTREKKGEN